MLMRKLVLILALVFLHGILVANSIQEKGFMIKGRVTEINGNPLPGAAIMIERTFLGTHSDSDGNYSFHSLKEGIYSLSISFIGYETLVREIKLTSDEVMNVTLSGKPFMTEEVLINATRAGEQSPLAYSTVDNISLKKQNTGQDMPYLLSLTPSLVETSEAGNGVGYTSLRIRGTDGNRINVTIDGIPLNDPESQQVFWVDLPDIASSVDNIQIQRGAGTSANGAGAFGATISLQTTNPDNLPFAEIGSSAGSFNTFKNMVSAGTGLLAGKFAFQMRYSDLKSDGYIERTGSDHRSAYISGLYRTDRSGLKANIIIGEEHTGIGWWGVPKEMLGINRRYNPAGEYTDEQGVVRYYNNESDNYKQNHLQLIYSLKINSYLSLHTALHYTKGKGYYEEYREDQPMSDYGLPPVNIGDTVISATDLVRRKWMSNDFYGLVYSLKYRNERIEAIAGGGMNLYEGDHYGNVIWMGVAGGTEKDYRWYLNNSVKGEVSLYGKLNYSLSDKLNLFGDLQYRYVSYSLAGIDDDLKDIGQEHKFGFINPKAGLFYSITSNQDAYFSFSVANREPTRTDFKEASGDLNSTPKAETLYDTEIGYKLRTGKSSLIINLYGMFYRDQLVPTGELSDVGYSIMTNVARSYRTGLEISAGIRPAEFISWDMNLTLSRNRIRDFTEYYVDYNTADWSSENQSVNLGEVEIAYSPSVTGTGDLAFNIIPCIGLHLIGKYVGKQYIDNTMNPERRLDPYFINNLRIDFDPVIKKIRAAEFQLLITNIFNKMYLSNGYGGNWYEDGIEKSWSYYFPQAGTGFMLRMSLRF
jgi:iron complex outermembrane receptor protein